MRLKGPALLAAALTLTALPAWAGNGHVLHGIGATNSAMGGAGVALPNDALGALHLNPALLADLEGSNFEFSAEYNKAKNAVESSVGPFSGRTEEAGDTALVPAFGFTNKKDGSKFAFGMGFLGMAGFGADYPQDSTNPLLAPQPQGFGRVYSNYQLMRVPNALAWKINDSLSVGLALNVARAALTANPAGFAAPDCSGPAGPCFVPSVNSDSAWGFGASVGIRYAINPTFAVGAAYNSEVDFEDFEWNTAHANPNLANFGTARTVKLQLNFPATFTAGIAITPGDRLAIALDGKLITYEDTEGFAETLGFEDINVIALGVQYKATDRFTLRAGYNKSDNPIPAERTFFTVATPAIFEDHYTVGVGIQATDNMQLNLTYYQVPENRISGPFVSPVIGPVPGTRVTTEMAMESVVATFSFHM
ncbi:MAG TPA: porin [Thermoanaerobaculia bacterium]|nr:porin [Thermoanaerobaculia bacterium]